MVLFKHQSFYLYKRLYKYISYIADFPFNFLSVRFYVCLFFRPIIMIIVYLSILCFVYQSFNNFAPIKSLLLFFIFLRLILPAQTTISSKWPNIFAKILFKISFCILCPQRLNKKKLQQVLKRVSGTLKKLYLKSSMEGGLGPSIY